jgi:hypothetical protein
MTRALLRWPALAGLAALIAILPSSCAVSDGYGYGAVGYAPDYYEPYGGVYGGWGPDYRVGPVRGGDHRFDRGPGRPAGGTPARHAFRAAPASRGAPSIPSGARPGGGHGGGRRP